MATAKKNHGCPYCSDAAMPEFDAISGAKVLRAGKRAGVATAAKSPRGKRRPPAHQGKKH